MMISTLLIHWWAKFNSWIIQNFLIVLKIVSFSYNLNFYRLIFDNEYTRFHYISNKFIKYIQYKFIEFFIYNVFSLFQTTQISWKI